MTNFFRQVHIRHSLQQICSLTLIFTAQRLCKRDLCFAPPPVSVSVHSARCHTRALCPNVWTYPHAVSATWYNPIFIVCGPPQGIGVPKTGRVQMIPILSNNRLYLTNGTTYQARRQGVPWVRPTPSPCDGASRLNDDDHVFSCVHSATNTNRYGARL